MKMVGIGGMGRFILLAMCSVECVSHLPILLLLMRDREDDRIADYLRAEEDGYVAPSGIKEVKGKGVEVTVMEVSEE